MKIMCLWTGEEWHVVSRVCIQSRQNNQSEPQICCGYMASKQKDAQKWRNQIAENMFDGMAVDGGDCNRGCPFVMLLVNILVDGLVMQ